jgi:hypothetical protein
MGTPYSFTFEKLEVICNMIHAGTPAKVACQAAGVPNRTYSAWLKKGREGIAPYDMFLERIEMAAAKHASAMAACVDNAARGGEWRAATWFLERGQGKDEFQKPVEKVQHSGAIGNVNVDSKTLDEATARKLRAQVLGVSVEDVELIEKKKFGLG